jgi:hypothetical protein
LIPWVHDGVIGISLFKVENDDEPCIVQSAGSAYRRTGWRRKQDFEDRGEFIRILLRYTQTFITQMAQTAVCNRHHTVDQQLARWLLICLDWLPHNSLMPTRELITDMLGMRRGEVTDDAGKLQKLSVITHSRGTITVLDRPPLECSSCECHGVVKKETDRLLPA